jgi:hypothetical protein
VKVFVPKAQKKKKERKALCRYHDKNNPFYWSIVVNPSSNPRFVASETLKMLFTSEKILGLIKEISNCPAGAFCG